MTNYRLFHDATTFLHSHVYMIAITSILFFALVGSWVLTVIFSRLRPRLAKTHYFWDESLLSSIYAPLMTLIWAFSVSALLYVLLRQLGINNSTAVDISRLHQFIFIGTLFWFVMRYIRHIEANLVEKPLQHRRVLNNKTNIRATAQVSRIVVVVLFGLAVMRAIGLEITTLLAFGGVGGLALSFAAKDSLANFFGGMMIYWDRPFSVGDWVRSPDRQIEGTVEEIGWRLTRIRTFDKRPLYVPNGIFSNILIENPQRMWNRRIKTTIGLRYQDAAKITDILADIEAMLRQHPEIDTRQTLMVNLFEFGPSALNFFVYVFTKTTNWIKFQSVQQDVFLQIIGIITKHGAECAYPTTTLQIPEAVVMVQPEDN